ncbi:MAG: aldehyde dehydrogenase (nadp) family protein [Bacteroidetes bacterium]|nr:aldehyde dehydrogenase (nadp) family protein [Bacteroidota bacterium]
MSPHPFLINGEWRTSRHVRQVVNPYDGKIAGEVCQASAGDIAEAIGAATSAFAVTRRLSSSERADVLASITEGIRSRKAEFAECVTRETGKPITYSRAEVDRSIFTFKTAAT